MTDESGIYAKLDSPLFGALVQAVEVAASALTAPLAAARVFNSPLHAPSLYVSAGRLRTTRREQAALEAWPASPRSLFDVIRQHGPAQMVFRPRELFSEGYGDGTSLYERIERLCPIKDALCAPLEVKGGAVWATAVFLRCEDQPPFSDAELDTLERLRPAMTRVILAGFEREMWRKQPTAAEVIDAGHPIGIHELIHRLSHTERAVLSHLRSRLTERQIAERMNRSRHTVHVHVKSIYRKLGVRSRQQLLNLFAEARA